MVPEAQGPTRGKTESPDGTPDAHSEEPRGIEKGIADADKKARTGSTEEPLRNTPPAGPWNDSASD